MAKFKRFDPGNRKEKHDKFKQREYTPLRNEHISKRKAERLYGIGDDFDDDNTVEEFQSQSLRSGLQ